jgi:hypothetical protein
MDIPRRYCNGTVSRKPCKRPSITARFPESCKERMPQAVQDERAHSAQSQCLLVLFLQCGFLKVSATGFGGPGPTFRGEQSASSSSDTTVCEQNQFRQQFSMSVIAWLEQLLLVCPRTGFPLRLAPQPLYVAATPEAILFSCPNCCAYSLRLNSNVTLSAS